MGFLILTFGIFITEKAIFSVENYQKDIDKISRLVNSLFKIKDIRRFLPKGKTCSGNLGNIRTAGGPGEPAGFGWHGDSVDSGAPAGVARPLRIPPDLFEFRRKR